MVDYDGDDNDIINETIGLWGIKMRIMICK